MHEHTSVARSVSPDMDLRLERFWNKNSKNVLSWGTSRLSPSRGRTRKNEQVAVNNQCTHLLANPRFLLPSVFWLHFCCSLKQQGLLCPTPYCPQHLHQSSDASGWFALALGWTQCFPWACNVHIKQVKVKLLSCLVNPQVQVWKEKVIEFLKGNVHSWYQNDVQGTSSDQWSLKWWERVREDSCILLLDTQSQRLRRSQIETIKEKGIVYID